MVAGGVDVDVIVSRPAASKKGGFGWDMAGESYCGGWQVGMMVACGLSPACVDACWLESGVVEIESAGLFFCSFPLSLVSFFLSSSWNHRMTKRYNSTSPAHPAELVESKGE